MSQLVTFPTRTKILFTTHPDTILSCYPAPSDHDGILATIKTPNRMTKKPP